MARVTANPFPELVWQGLLVDHNGPESAFYDTRYSFGVLRGPQGPSGKITLDLRGVVHLSPSRPWNSADDLTKALVRTFRAAARTGKDIMEITPEFHGRKDQGPYWRITQSLYDFSENPFTVLVSSALDPEEFPNAVPDAVSGDRIVQVPFLPKKEILICKNAESTGVFSTVKHRAEDPLTGDWMIDPRAVHGFRVVGKRPTRKEKSSE